MASTTRACRGRRTLLLAEAGLLLASWSATASAEGAKEAAEELSGTISRAAATSDDGEAAPVEVAAAEIGSVDDQLGEIVVTATKRATNLQDTPIAISVIGEQMLEDRRAQSLLDLTDGAVPSLRVATFESRQSALTVGIRGIVPFDANQTARDQGVGVYIDGIYLGRQQGLNAALFDIERIEVLRGPQGTLFGRNTEGGALNIVTRAPTGAFGGRVSGGVGNFGSYNAEAHIDLPAFANLAFKLDGLVQHQGATTKNPLQGEKGWNYYHRVGGRAAARWQPVDGLTVDLSYDRARDENTPFYSQLINFNPNGYNVGSYGGTSGTQLRFNNAPCNVVVAGTLTNPCIAPLSPLVVVSGDRRQKEAEIGVPQQPSVDETQGLTAAIRYALTPDLELRSISGWREVETHQFDNSGGAHRTTFVPNANFSRYSLSELSQRQWSQEFQAVGSVASLDYVLGLYYFTEKVRETAATPTTNRWNSAGTGYTINSPDVLPPISSSNQGWQREDWFVARDSQATAKSYAVFGQATWTPPGLEALHVTAGARYTYDKRDGALTVFNNVAVNFPFRYREGRIDPMVTLAFDAARDLHLYAKYATGFRAGGANSRSQTFSAFGPESVDSFELGAKSEFLDRRVRLNVAAYLMNRKGTQTDFDFVDVRRTLADGSPNPNFNRHYEETANAPGTSKIKGFEADLTVQPIDELQLSASYAYTDINVPPTANPFLPGNPLFQVYTVFTPKHAASGAIDYEVPAGFADANIRLHLDANYAGRQYSFQSEPVRTDSSFIVNGSLALTDITMNDGEAQLRLALWARNLLNETHIYRRSAANSSPVIDSITGIPSYSGVLGDYGNLNAPRTFGVEARISF
ncbi:TonB-dependent receptor [Sphingomonas parva]|uniref:TonB-dependent receptor n=1 Tax=Sphingomonas parva TaxID=2555898 RepID=UPI001CDB5A07|nr:TonB-dependent receptor [Sphingomonas parva]